MKKSFLIGCILFLLAAFASIWTGVLAVNRIEAQSVRDVALALRTDRHEWAKVSADGLRVIITGIAPDEAKRFEALSVAGETVDADRIIDRISIKPPEGLNPPRYSIEILRNGPGISLIGLVPGQTNRESILEAINGLDDTATVTDMLDSADNGAPEGWDAAVDFAVTALEMLPSAKVSVSAQRVAISAISDSPEEKQRLETALVRAAPDGLNLLLNISAPRPVITPFTLRFVLDADGARFDSCSADTEAGREAILAAARKAGVEGKAECTIGLGTPSPRWSDAAAKAIAAVADLQGGRLTFSDADISLIAPDTTPRARFDDIVHALETGLPDVFSLHAVLPQRPASADDGAAPEINEFTATRSPEGLVQLGGRLNDLPFQRAVNSFARARLGGQIRDTTRIDPELPDGWPMLVLTGLEGLGKLHSGSLTVQQEHLELSGISTSPDTRAEITKLFSEKLSEAQQFEISISYAKHLDPLANLPSPEECVSDISQVLAAQQITFTPGSGTIDDDAVSVVDHIAKILETCAEVPMQILISGHTDSQGRESMNLALSQARAEAVLDALLERGILTTNMTAKGFGETTPIADNETEAGREANRRIEFTLVLPDQPEPETEPDQAEPAAGEAPSEDTTEETGNGQN